MGFRRAHLLAGLLAAGGIAVGLRLVLPEGAVPRAGPGAGRSFVSEPGRPGARESRGQERPAPDLYAALTGPRAAEAAAALRRAIRTDEAARRGAEAALRDPATPRDTGMVLMLVLGSIGGSDEVLLAALSAFEADAEAIRCLLLALGATRDPADDDDVFDLGDRPWGAAGPAGLGITVRREIGDARVRAALAGALRHADESVRRSAAMALRHSLGEADARDAFLAALDTERADSVATEIGEALAQWVGSAGDGASNAVVLSRLLARAVDEGLDGYRFRLEDDLGRVALGPSDRALLVEYSHPSQPFPLRTFALTILATGAVRSGEGAVAQTRALLLRTASGDVDGAARDLAARLLAALPYDEGTVARLAATSREDPAWNLRYTCVETLAEFGPRPDVMAGLEAARADHDPRVADRARVLHERLSGR